MNLVVENHRPALCADWGLACPAIVAWGIISPMLRYVIIQHDTHQTWKHLSWLESTVAQLQLHQVLFFPLWTFFFATKNLQPPAEQLKPGINILFLVGGDGTQFAGNLLFEEAQKRNLPVSIVGIPKSIDNDAWAAVCEGRLSPVGSRVAKHLRNLSVFILSKLMNEIPKPCLVFRKRE